MNYLSSCIPGAVLAVTWLAACFPISAQTKILLDSASPGKVYEGIGALSAGASSRLLYDYREPYRSQILDYLFKPGYGAALQHLKVEIGGDVNSTDGSEPGFMRSRDDRDYTRGYEWWLMEEARKRNPKIILDALPWGAPGWVGTDTLYTPQMARYVAEFLQGAATVRHLDIAYTGSWNEKQFDAAYIKDLDGELRKRHLSTRIICCDEYAGEGLGQWSIVDAMKTDPELAKAVYAIGVHYSLVDGNYTTPSSARISGKPLWSSEDQPNTGSGPIVSREWQIGGRILPRLYNRNYIEGGFTKTEIWSPVTSYYDILAAPNSGLMYANTPWSGFYNVQGAIWATAHTTQFVQPGWQYLDPACGRLPEKGSYVSLKSPDDQAWTVVAETIDAKGPQEITLRVHGKLPATTIHVWQTNGAHTFTHVADIQPHNEQVNYSLEADSLYTFSTTTGQGKGTAQPPPQQPFPFPYSDDFETTSLMRAPRFLSDQDGAFEAHPCDHRKGKCLEQVITRRPIPWSPLPDPFTLAGDAQWTDYRIAVDFLPGKDTSVRVMGRIDSADVFQDAKAVWPSGYVLSIDPGGRWTLSTSAYKVATRTLASGSLPPAAVQWRHAELSFKGTQITAACDGTILATVSDTSHTRGMFALGTAWSRTQFDNLSITAP